MLRALWKPSTAVVKPRQPVPGPELPAARFRRVVDLHYADVWRAVRRLGVAEALAEDAAQHVFLIVSSKLGQIVPGKERAFLLSTAVGVAANHRRSAPVRNEHPSDDLDSFAAETPGPDELIDEKRLRLLLDEVLDAVPDDLRAVLVLFELEGLGLSEISEILEIPRGTAASRLRRARETFEAGARRVRARQAFFKET